jgi:predicted PurR-regulated permease PerM
VNKPQPTIPLHPDAEPVTEPPPLLASPSTLSESQQRVLLHMPVDVRSASMALIAVLLSIYALHWAAAVAIPLLLGFMFSYAMSPPVDWLERKRVPRWLGAAVLLMAVIGSIGWTGFALADDAAQLVESLPAAAQKVRTSMRDFVGTKPGTLDKVQIAASELEKAAAGNPIPSAAGTPKGVTRVQVVQTKFNVHDYLWTGTVGLIGLAGQIAVVCFLAYFLVASGSSFRRKMVHIAGPTFTQKRITVQALDEITQQIQRYLLMQVFISALVGVATWLAFIAVGVKHAAVWGIAAAVLNFVPYVGSIAIAVVSSIVALMQFDSMNMALTVAGICFGIHIVSGYILTPWLTSRASRLSPVAIFVSVLIWGWLWGVWGMLLGVPIVMIVKAVCDRVDGFKPLGELLGT